MYQSFQDRHSMQPSFHFTITMGHEGHTAGIVTHCMPLVSVGILAKRKERPPSPWEGAAPDTDTP